MIPGPDRRGGGADRRGGGSGEHSGSARFAAGSDQQGGSGRYGGQHEQAGPHKRNGPSQDSGPQKDGGRHKHIRLGEIADTAGVSKATASRALRDPGSVSAGSAAKVARALAVLGVEGEVRTPAAELPLIALIRPWLPAGSVDPYDRLFRLLTDKIFALGLVAVHIEAVAGRAEALAELLMGTPSPAAPTHDIRSLGRSVGIRTAAGIGGRMATGSGTVGSSGVESGRVGSGLRAPGDPGAGSAIGRNHHVQGAIVLGGGAAGQLAGVLAASGLPLIRVSNARHDDGIDAIFLDAAMGIDTAVQHLVHLGHRRIGLAVLGDSAAASRIAAFRKAMAGVLHIPATRDQAPVVEAAGGPMPGVAAAEELLRQRCTAVIACAPSLSLGVLDAAARARIDVPRDLSLLTVGDMPDADLIAPPLSQVSYDWEIIADSALAEVRTMMAASAEAGGRAPEDGAMPGGGAVPSGGQMSGDSLVPGDERGVSAGLPGAPDLAGAQGRGVDPAEAGGRGADRMAAGGRGTGSGRSGSKASGPRINYTVTPDLVLRASAVPPQRR